MPTTEDVSSTLNNLIETNKDGAEGYKTSADAVKDAEIKTLFNTYAQQRSQFASELQAEVRKMGGDPEKTGSVLASLHRGWINIKSTVTGMDDHAILAEAERGEDIAVSNYQDAMKETLPADLMSVVQRQYGQIKEAHDRVRNLRDARA